MIARTLVRSACRILPATLPAAAPAQSRAVEVAQWQPYGAPFAYERDARIPGGGAIRLDPPSAAGEIWSSGAGLPIAAPLKAGQRVTAAFWARADRPAAVAVTIQGGAPTYAALGIARIALTPAWRRYRVDGVAHHDLPAGSQSLTIQTGRAGAPISLGPVAFLPGRPDAAAMRTAFRGFHPRAIAQDVRIPSDRDVVLAGTLRIPDRPGAAPFPLAILIQGHGPNGRGGFTRLSDRLLADGIATLEYDKRGIGASTGPYSEDGEALTRDATAAVAAMRRRPELDGGRIALVGHSQGGAIAPAVAAADPRIAAVVTFAGPVGDGMTLFRRSMHDQLIAYGRTETTVAPLVEASVRLIQARVDRAGASTVAPLRTAVRDGFVAAGFTPAEAEGALATIDRDEVYQIAQAHIASDLRALRIPVLAVFGTLDPLVTAPGNAAAAREALAGNPAARVVVFDGLSHWFQDGARTGAEAEVATLGPNLGSPRAVSLAGDWLQTVLKPAERPFASAPRR